MIRTTTRRRDAVRVTKRKKGRALVAACVFAVSAVGATMVSTNAGASLPGSNFEANDGNLIPNGGIDWTNAPNRVVGNDLSTGQGDSSFGNGTAENDVNVTTGFGSIPNGKADLSQFLVANETGANGHTYLYLGWTRNNSGGTTNFDFEINKLEQPPFLAPPGAKTLNRSVGDLLVNYLFQGQGTPTVVVRTWTGTAWSTEASGVVYEAAINSGPLPNPFGTPNPIPTEQFGEAAVDLTASNLIPSGSCAGFSSAYVKTRASTSFQSEVKDFVPPQHVDINTCSHIIVDKVTVPSGSTQVFDFVKTGTGYAGALQLTDAATPNDSGPLSPGTYSVAETPVPTNWTLTSAVCHDNAAPAVDIDPANIVLTNTPRTITCTFTNTLKTGAILIHKDRKHAADGPGDHPHAGVAFSINGASVGTTDANGNICVDDLTFGDYVVTESVPTGYVSADSEQTATVDNLAFCDDAPYVGETVNFDNTPLTNVSITVTSQVVGGTSNTVSCNNGSGDTDGGDVSLTLNDQQPKTLVCTIVIDP